MSTISNGICSAVLTPSPEQARHDLLRIYEAALQAVNGRSCVKQHLDHISLADPVVTCSDDRLRFEGFSGCCGAYARVDFLPSAITGDVFGRGTTNVDFNQPI